MNTTREQRAEAYVRCVDTLDLVLNPQDAAEKAYIAGAQEEAAIKDAVIRDLAKALKPFASKDDEGACTCGADDYPNYGEVGCYYHEAIGTLKKHSTLIEELAKAKEVKL